jgi:hypothetical protein
VRSVNAIGQIKVEETVDFGERNDLRKAFRVFEIEVSFQLTPVP